MADRTDVLIQQWLSRWEQIRHSENQRATATNMILVLAVAGLGFIAQKGLRPGMLIVSGTLILLGTFGFILSIKYYERFKLHLTEAGALRQKLDEQYPDLGISDAIEIAYEKHSREYPRISRVPLFSLWLLLHLAIALVGVLLSLAILLKK